MTFKREELKQYETMVLEMGGPVLPRRVEVIGLKWAWLGTRSWRSLCLTRSVAQRAWAVVPLLGLDGTLRCRDEKLPRNSHPSNGNNAIIIHDEQKAHGMQ